MQVQAETALRVRNMAAKLGFRAFGATASRGLCEPLGTRKCVQDALQAGDGDRRGCYPPVTTRLGTLTST